MVMEQRIVCAANKDINTGNIVLGIRHYDSFQCQHMKSWGLRGFSWKSNETEQGFIDNRGQFLTREEAWLVAETAGQIIRRVGGDMSEDGVGKLFSENLY
jgi:hypothetical protein